MPQQPILLVPFKYFFSFDDNRFIDTLQKHGWSNLSRYSAFRIIAAYHAAPENFEKFQQDMYAADPSNRMPVKTFLTHWNNNLSFHTEAIDNFLIFLEFAQRVQIVLCSFCSRIIKYSRFLGLNPGIHFCTDL